MNAGLQEQNRPVELVNLDEEARAWEDAGRLDDLQADQEAQD